MIKYHPNKVKPNKKYYIITNNDIKVYFGQAGASNFTLHKDEARKQRYINRHKNNEIWSAAGARSRVGVQRLHRLSGPFGAFLFRTNIVAISSDIDANQRIWICRV